ncbi:glycosyltransferase family 4 protein [Myroides sp. C8-3]|uniref:glycosyltransferase family 4 protein n=1 Tax=Myroides sp. C8-3 TaxID=3400533 RepID=UPI003D2F8874
MKKLFIVSELFYPNKTSTAYIMTELAKYFKGSYDVSVLTTDLAYDSNISEEENDLAFCIRRSKVSNVNKNSFVSRIKGAISSSFLLTKAVMKHVKKGEKVLAVTNPFLIIFFLAVLRKFKKFDYILLVHDVFPENTIPAGLKSKDSLSYKIIKSIFDWSYRQADKIIVLGGDMKQLLITKRVQKDKITVIANWYDSELVYRSDVNVNEYLGGFNFESKVIIGFAGNVGRVQGLDLFINSFKKANNRNICFVVVGEGAQLDELKKISEGDENIIFLGSKPREEQSIFLNTFDIGLVTLAKGMYGLGVPSKSYNLLHLGKPILYIGDCDSEIDIMIKKHDCGWSFDWDNDNELVDFLMSITPINTKYNYNRNSTIAEEYYCKDKIMKQFEFVVNGK